MKLDTSLVESRLRSAALLLMSLPATVAAACFAHGHGTVGSSALLAILIVAIVAGAVGAYRLLSLTRREPVAFDTDPDFDSSAAIRSSD